MIDRSNAFAWSLVLAALLHAVVIGWVRLPQLRSKRQHSRPLVVRLFSIAEEPAAVQTAVHPPATRSRSSAAARPAELPAKLPTDAPEAVARRRAAPAPTLVGDEASRQDESRQQSALTSADAVRATYEQALAAWLDRVKYYPAAVRKRGLEGGGELRVRIDRSGRVLSLTMSRSLPHPILDEVAQNWVHRADPFPVIPPSIKGENFEFLVPVSFRLN